MFYFALKYEMLAGFSSPSLCHVALDEMAQLGTGESTSKMTH